MNCLFKYKNILAESGTKNNSFPFHFNAILFFVFFHFFSFSGSAQLYIGGEFNYPFFATDLNLTETNVQSGARTRYSNPKLKPAGIYSLSADLGWSITKFLSIETEIEYFENNISWRNEYINTGSSFNSYDASFNYKKHFEGLFFRPGFIFSIDKTKSFVPYIKLGGIIAIIDQNQNYSRSESYYNGDILNESQTRRYSYDTQFGITSSLGFEFKCSQIFVPYLEAKIDFLSLSPHSSELTSWYNNGEDLLRNATFREKYTDFVDSFYADDLTDNQPDKSLIFHEPFSRVSGNFGIRIYLWKKKQNLLEDSLTNMN
jgi:hypothetical protein